MGNNQVAFDAVCCNIIGVDPNTVDHIRLAAEHGFGTIDLEKIEITGDVTLEEAQGAREGLQGRADPRREVLRGHAHHRVRGAAAGVRGTATTAGAAARARSRRRSRSCACSTSRLRREDAAPARRVRRLRRPDRRQARREGRVHRRLRRVEGRASTASRSQIKNVYKDRSDAGSAHRDGTRTSS